MSEVVNPAHFAALIGNVRSRRILQPATIRAHNIRRSRAEFSFMLARCSATSGSLSILAKWFMRWDADTSPNNAQ